MVFKDENDTFVSNLTYKQVAFSGTVIIRD